MHRTLFFTVAVVVLLVTGCATQQKGKGEETATAAQAQGGPSKESAEQTVIPKQEAAAEEPVVEVIPRDTSDRPDLTLERLPVEKSVEETVQEPKAEVTESKQPLSEISPPDATISKPAIKSVPQAPVQAESTSDQAASTTEEKTPSTIVPKDGEFVITVVNKNNTHPFYGKGHMLGFAVNGVQGRQIVMERGKEYKIIVDTDPKHDVYLSTKDIGWGSTPWTDGVEGMFTYKGTITVKPDDKTPDLLYYSCRNHPYMGGTIHIVNPGQVVEIKKHEVSAETKNAAETITEVASEAKVNQKLMFAKMLLNSNSGKRIAESGIQDAIDLQNQAKKLITQAEEKMKAGDNSSAYNDADSALNMLKKSSRLVPSDEEMQALKTRYKELQGSVAEYEKSHADNVKRITKAKGNSAAVQYDKDLVEKLKASAEASVKTGNYAKANKDLDDAQHHITVALQKMLESQTIVYDLNFETPQEEYDYELKRFGGYEELIPVAIEAKKPAPGAIQLMNNFLEKAQKMRDEAKQKAASGDYPTAIKMMQDATVTVRRALRMVGVMQ